MEWWKEEVALLDAPSSSQSAAWEFLSTLFGAGVCVCVCARASDCLPLWGHDTYLLHCLLFG